MKVYELLQDTEYIYIVTEFIRGGELLDRLLLCTTFSESRASYIMHQILMGLSNLHGERIVHRDLKLENILLTSTDPSILDIKIADFGFAKKIKLGEKEELQCGTPIYMAPEVFHPNEEEKEPGYEFEVDIWSAGVIAFILLNG